MEERRTARAYEAAVLAAKRQNELLAGAARARDSLDSLRGTLDAAERVAQESKAASDKHRIALGELFVACGKELQELAAKADGHASDVRLLLDSWPK
jgi:hypothetical protein